MAVGGALLAAAAVTVEAAAEEAAAEVENGSVLALEFTGLGCLIGLSSPKLGRSGTPSPWLPASRSSAAEAAAPERFLAERVAERLAERRARAAAERLRRFPAGVFPFPGVEEPSAAAAAFGTERSMSLTADTELSSRPPVCRTTEEFDRVIKRDLILVM